MAAATSLMIHQSGRACPGGGWNARWREMQRSELVTVPSRSPQLAAGSTMSATAVVSVSVMSDTTTSSQRASAARTRSASGRLTTGLVAMIHSALIRPSATASNNDTAFSPGVSGRYGLRQNDCTSARSSDDSSLRCAAN